MAKRNLYDFDGKHLKVQWHKKLCIHVAECGKAEGNVFEMGRDPWCMPDQASAEQVLDIIQRCPSGALSCKDNNTVLEQATEQNSVAVTVDGPLYLRGDLKISGTNHEMPGTQFRAALCRCGKSANKPFCDNSHKAAGFQDAAEITGNDATLESPGGSMEVTPITNGPLIIKGNLTLFDGTGNAVWRGASTALCRCGESSNKPFCDGSHVASGFTTD